MTADPTSRNVALPPAPWNSRQVAGRTAPGVLGSSRQTSSRVRPPAPTRHLIDRPRLIDRLSDAVEDSPLTLISAPAGYGKTVLAAAWTRSQQNRPVAWLTLTDRDGQPNVFWSRVLMAFACVGVLAADLPPILTDGFDLEELGEVLLVAGPVVLVLDGAEKVQSRTVFAELARLLEHAGARVRVVMTARADPPMPLHRYRLDGTVTEIRFDDLVFTDPEKAAALKAHGVPPSGQPSRRALSRLEGWPAGVRIAAVCLQRGQPDSRQNDAVADYLEAEVLDALADSDRELLLRLSVVDDLPPGLASTLTDRLDADELLKRMSSGNTFVLPIPMLPGYRIHPVLRQVLTTRLGQREPEAVTELHGRAADWYAAQGEIRLAVEHAAAIGDWERAAGFVLDGGGVADLLQMSSTGIRLATCLASMPDLDAHDVQLVHAVIAVGERRPDSARAAVARVEEAGHASPVGRGGRKRALTAAVVRTLLCDLAGDVDQTLSAAGRLREQLPVPTDRRDPHSEVLRALVRQAEGSARLRGGDLDGACDALRAVSEAAAGGGEDLRRHCLATLALAEACRGRLTISQGLVDELVRIGDVPVAGWLALAWVAIERQDLRRGRDALDSLARLRPAAGDGLLDSVSMLLRARLLRDRGDLAGARHLLAGIELAHDWLAPLVRSEAMAVGVPVDVEELRSAPAGSIAERVHEGLVLAHACRLAGDLGAARTGLTHALCIAEGEQLRRPFAHLPAETRSLLRSDHELQAKAGWLKPDLTGPASGRRSNMDREPLRVDLSARELEVLRHLGDLYTTEEIAAQLFISVNTVRTHVRRILEKLGVSRRYEAVRRGRDLGLV